MIAHHFHYFKMCIADESDLFDTLGNLHIAIINNMSNVVGFAPLDGTLKSGMGHFVDVVHVDDQKLAASVDAAVLPSPMYQPQDSALRGWTTAGGRGYIFRASGT